MSDLLKHVVVADFLGDMMAHSDNRYINMTTAFGLGVASHAVMDISEPDFTVNWFNFVQLKGATPFLGLQAVGVWFVIRTMFRETKGDFRAFRLRLAAIVGSIFPDVVDGIYAMINPRAWYAGQMLFPWHRLTWQVNPMSMWATTLFTAGLMGLRYVVFPLLATLGLRPRSTGRS